ncbi:MAG: two-component system, OmpR family, sensor histidine kinase VicK [Thermosediminibacterales bacterium]|nr:two-component system, OmpR family, sensor histidine kinase VicK [Thermosediminibacterales bacterium]MDK2835819.1 two-component system, OmpR family, sensor histidine kinase VicK [Thermosediminibacterales bacterium]
MFKSIQWKMVIIYLLLVLLAMEVIGVYLLRSLEQYHLDNLSAYLDNQAQLISGFLERYLANTVDTQQIDDLIREFGNRMGMEIKDIFVLDKNGIVISSSNIDTTQTGKRILTPEVTEALMGEKGEDIRTDFATKKRFKYLAFPVKSGEKVLGVIYLVSSLENIYNTLQEIKAILVMATVIALFVTAVLGFALAKTITGPIQEVTSKAASLARGDFDQLIEVKSNDEIGQLTEMFNYLTLRLKETLDEISNEKSKVEAILAYMADGIIAVNKNDEIIHINPAAERLLDINRDVVGKKFSALFSDYFRDNPLQYYIEDSKTENRKDREVVIKHDSSVLRAHFAPFKNEKGEVSGVVIVLRDVTEQERLENMRKEFVANVSHEIKTPITTIKSYVETLLAGAIEEKNLAERFLEVVNNEADRMARLVSDLLQLSRLDYQQTRWDKKLLSLEQIVEDVLVKLNMEIKQKKMNVSVNYSKKLPKVLGDRDRIEQVILNIVGNALKYTPEGGDIKISIETIDKAVCLKVQDNGIGIPKEDLPRIFERFYRVDKARSRELGGTGLGLSIAKQIIEAHGGTININSEYGHGTEVVINLPGADDCSSSSERADLN